MECALLLFSFKFVIVIACSRKQLLHRCLSATELMSVHKTGSTRWFRNPSLRFAGRLACQWFSTVLLIALHRVLHFLHTLSSSKYADGALLSAKSSGDVTWLQNALLMLGRAQRSELTTGKHGRPGGFKVSYNYVEMALLQLNRDFSL